MDSTLTVAEVFTLKLAGQRHGTVEHFDAVGLFDNGYHNVLYSLRKLGPEGLTAIVDGLVEKGLFAHDEEGYIVTELGKDVMRQLFPHTGDGRTAFKGGY